MRPSRAAPHAALASRSACGPREPLRMRPSRAAPRPSHGGHRDFASRSAAVASRSARSRREPLRGPREPLRGPREPLRGGPRAGRSAHAAPPRWPTRTDTFRFNFSDARVAPGAPPSPTARVPCCVYSEFSGSHAVHAKNRGSLTHFRQNSRDSRDSGASALAALGLAAWPRRSGGMRVCVSRGPGCRARGGHACPCGLLSAVSASRQRGRARLGGRQ
jgi:hypothetical protein